MTNLFDDNGNLKMSVPKKPEEKKTPLVTIKPEFNSENSRKKAIIGHYSKLKHIYNAENDADLSWLTLNYNHANNTFVHCHQYAKIIQDAGIKSTKPHPTHPAVLSYINGDADFLQKMKSKEFNLNDCHNEFNDLYPDLLTFEQFEIEIALIETESIKFFKPKYKKND